MGNTGVEIEDYNEWSEPPIDHPSPQTMGSAWAQGEAETCSTMKITIRKFFAIVEWQLLTDLK